MSDNIPFEIYEEIMKRVPIKPLLQMMIPVIWNPTIKKSISVDVPIVLGSKEYNTSVGFGVCPRTLDPMLVNISIGYWWEEVNSTTATTWRVKVAIDRFIYWHALDRISGSSFDMISEEFREIRLPANLALNLDMRLYICKFKESLVVIHYEFNVEKAEWDVWMMENGDPESFRKIHTIKSDNDNSIARSTSETVELITSCSTAIEVVGKLDVLRVDSCLTPSSQGLFCLYYSPGEPSDLGTRTAVIWNPTIKKSIAIDVPVLLDSKKKFYTYAGFGVCPQTLDPMLVNISIEYNIYLPSAEPFTSPLLVRYHHPLLLEDPSYLTPQSKMSDNIPFEIQIEIMKRLPIKPLLQFRTVSKAWKSLIDSSEFIAAYQHTERQHHLLVRDDFRQNYVCVADDDTFPNQKVTLTVPTSVTQFYKPEILGEPSDFGTRTAVIWNPTINKSIAIDVPVLLDSKNKFYTYAGFGVFRLSSGTWKSLSINLPRRTIELLTNQVEETRPISAGNSHMKLLKFKESLVVIHFAFDVDVTDWDVWVMENGDPESFRKIYTIKSDIRDDDSIVSVFGSRKSGEPLVEATKCFRVEKEGFELFVYNPNSEHIDYIGISAKRSSFVVKAYTETPLLLDH
nr:hypothetical protein [Tanacetum cinerariifolium]